MAKFQGIDADYSTTTKSIDEINYHVDHIKGVVEMWIKFTPKDNIMFKVFSDVQNRLERIQSLNDNLNHHSGTNREHKQDNRES